MNKNFTAVRRAVFFALVLGMCAVAFADEYDDYGSSSGGGASTSGGSSDDGFDIMKMFGDFKDEPEPVQVVPTKKELPPFEGEYKLLIARPSYGSFDAETKTKWVSAMAEAFMYYKISSFPRTHVFTMEQVSSVTQNSRDFSRKITKPQYISAGRRLGATHILFQEYQPDKSGKKTLYTMELWWIQESGMVVTSKVEVPFNDFEGGLQACLTKVAGAMDPGAKNTAAFKNTGVLGKDQKALEAFGNILANEGRFIRDNSIAAYTQSEKVLQKNTQIGFQYAAALLAGRAENYAKAIGHLDAVISKSSDHPALQLRRAEYLRGAERHSEAMTAAETAARNSALRLPASIEMAMIYKAQGNIDRARSEYETIVQNGEADGRVFFMLALLSIQTGRISESEGYLRQAAERGLALDEGEYIELGRAYSAAGSGNEEKAIEFLKRGLGLKQNNEEAWQEMAEVYKRMGDERLAAEAYVNLFKINQQGHSFKLKDAGGIYERLGMTEKAKDAYSLFLDRRFTDTEVSLSLARIYYNENDCKRLQPVLRGLETLPDAMKMLEDCNIKVKVLDHDKTMRVTKLSPVMFTMRISGAVLAAGGLAGGLYMNYGVIDPTYEKYSNYPDSPQDVSSGSTDAMDADKVDKMHKDIESAQFWRNTLYVLSGIGLSAVAVTFFF